MFNQFLQCRQISSSRPVAEGLFNNINQSVQSGARFCLGGGIGVCIAAMVGKDCYEHLSRKVVFLVKQSLHARANGHRPVYAYKKKNDGSAGAQVNSENRVVVKNKYGIFGVTTYVYTALLVYAINANIRQILSEPVSTHHRKQEIESHTHYYHGLATNFSTSHLDDDRAGCNTALLSPEWTESENRTRSHHTACTWDCEGQVDQDGMPKGLPRCRKQCGELTCIPHVIRWADTQGVIQ
jgi:hypothetical protein